MVLRQWIHSFAAALLVAVPLGLADAQKPNATAVTPSTKPDVLPWRPGAAEQPWVPVMVRWRANAEPITTSVVKSGDMAITQGDIALGRYDEVIGKTSKDNAVSSPNQRWPKGIVPYVIDPSLSALAPLIKQAATHISQKTGNCIRFVPRTQEQNYVKIMKGQGCYSYVGPTGSGAQQLSLGAGCEYLGTAVHQMVHAVGFLHEQNRPDRDQFLTIDHDNILPGQENSFDVTQGSVVNTPFDYDSIMLYGESAFSKSASRKTMVDKTGKHKLVEPYEKTGMSPTDVFKVKQFYGCK